MTGILSLIGNTPLLKISKIDTGPCELFVKLENQNPGGSIKDRMALSMIQAAEASGALKKGGTIVEATAGNTGLSLALVAAIRGYTLILVIPDKMSREKIEHLRAFGAQIILTRSDVGKGHPEYYQDVAAAIAKSTPGAYYIDQFSNPTNPYGHETTTAPEIWEQMEHRVDAIVCGVGSGGTMTGISNYFARVAPSVELVLADPKGSILKEYVDTGVIPTTVGSWLVEGIGEDFIPKTCDLSRVKKAYSITDAESFEAARMLLKKEGILAGSSAGTLFAATLKYCREQTSPKRVVTFICDSGNKYLSKMFNDYWMIDQGFIERPSTGDLRDLIARLAADGRVISAAPTDTVSMVHARMKLYEVSQLPVVDGGTILGLVDESDLLSAALKDRSVFSQPISTIMTRQLVTLSPASTLEELYEVLGKDLTAVVVEDGKLLGLITRIDALNYLRRRQK